MIRMPSKRPGFEELGRELGALVDAKQEQYGNSAGRSDAMLAVLYPNGIQVYQYRDVLLTARILDKLSRIAQRGPDGKDLGGESPYRDIGGYGLLGWEMDGGAP